jgi:hypothetical protein
MENHYHPPTTPVEPTQARKTPWSWSLYPQIPSMLLALLFLAALLVGERMPAWKQASVGLSALASIVVGILVFHLAQAIAPIRQRGWIYLIWALAGLFWSFLLALAVNSSSMLAMNAFDTTGRLVVPFSYLPKMAIEVASGQILRYAIFLLPTFMFMCWRMRKFNRFVSGQPNHSMHPDGAASGTAGDAGR